MECFFFLSCRQIESNVVCWTNANLLLWICSQSFPLFFFQNPIGFEFVDYKQKATIHTDRPPLAGKRLNLSIGSLWMSGRAQCVDRAIGEQYPMMFWSIGICHSSHCTLALISVCCWGQLDVSYWVIGLCHTHVSLLLVGVMWSARGVGLSVYRIAFGTPPCTSSCHWVSPQPVFTKCIGGAVNIYGCNGATVAHISSNRLFPKEANWPIGVLSAFLPWLGDWAQWLRRQELESSLVDWSGNCIMYSLAEGIAHGHCWLVLTLLSVYGLCAVQQNLRRILGNKRVKS